MYKLRTILYHFNRPVFALNMLLSLYLIYRHDIFSVPGAIFAKFCGYGAIVGYQYFTANQTYFYFRNAGYSIKQLYIYSIIADLVIFIILSFIPIIIHGIIHA
jgi:hypothetical protein